MLPIIFLTACDKDDPTPPVEEELITTLEYVLKTTPDDPGITLRFEDLDGDGGNDPVITGGTLQQFTSYTGTITLLNESEDPAENITEEIDEEDEEHQLFFQSTIDGIDVDYTDEDDDGNPLGLTTTLTTGAAETGTLTITLRHEPNKEAAGVSNGDITNAGGETDIEVTFDIEIQ